ncbi:ATP-dependent Clp protease adaptor ClpS [Prosthecobacter fusiformis]|nr:ATP-dependent Clp protease adaptor ClpS [Prosthecobacter fusiformis]
MEETLQIRCFRAAAPVMPERPRTAPAQPQMLPDLEPPYHVILHNDDTHTYAYVIEMMMAIFGYDEKKGYRIACEVDESDRVIVVTCHKELAELRVEQIHEYGADPRMKESVGSMKASMEPAE